ncbi:hypothetical protein SAMN02745163_01243 [Clostridium cavendishii DSM 21758]|uniref:Uncharacterized protein n=1 Tax=Clostridium cavendishii DSM 21758 TaxID=1121302 RepID=A0A1M6GC26_9CLOT|nr:hypothetical protein SAMN02745163_01243 [Clostridium cavendishii DSM 21758]
MYYSYSSSFITFVIALLVAMTIYFVIKKSKAGVKASVISIVLILVWYIFKRLSFQLAIMKFRFAWGFNRFTYNLSFLIHILIIFVVLYALFKIFGKK